VKDFKSLFYQDEMNTALNVIPTPEMHFLIAVIIAILTRFLVVVTRLSGGMTIGLPVNQLSCAAIVGLYTDI
jgi:hypothetical protein